MKKSEARIARGEAKRLAEIEKSARLRERIPAGGVRLDETLSSPKTARAGENPGSIFGMRMEWTQDGADLIDAWSWGTARQWSEDDWNGNVLPKLQEWEKLTWAEIDRPSSDSGHKMHHNMDTPEICEEAQFRLLEIERHADVIFRFRLGNKRRLWGHRIVNKFEIVWYDPTHGIYPTDPD
ncbi:hypothetical protein IHQ71_30945 (plasmid) [Rhizobium sp. TH2]|uniref:hypothetical protein n=1 Tax=Rhizobium sp. TH2 TaxID=2775403 RepID=UPI00215773D1|nr:hypothetical protein [Rhizobium sp. TH2]UVC12421.1 hypothetical protein IHQ71_30945 [Rhizobium sp. TH2]